jgi:hypothetical protein
MSTPARTLKVFRYAMFFDGLSSRAYIEPFVVYGWKEITIEEYFYLFNPKAKPAYSHWSMIGNPWAGEPALLFTTGPTVVLDRVGVEFHTRTETGRVAYMRGFPLPWNTWIHVVRRFTADRVFSFLVNCSIMWQFTVPQNEVTILEFDPDTASDPSYHKRLTLGFSTRFSDFTKMYYAHVRVYSRALEDWEIRYNFSYPYNPVRNGLELYLLAHPDYIKDIDGDGILEWVDLSGKNRHAKIYNAQLVEIIKQPVRVLARAR